MNVYARIRSELLVLVGLAVAYCNHKFGWGLSQGEVLGFLGTVALVVCKHWHLDAKFPEVAGLVKKIAAAGAVLVLALAMGGCSLTPQQIETDTAVAVNVGLNGATIFDKGKADEIKTDAIAVAQAINSAVLPQFQPGATSGALLNSAVQQATLHLQARLASLKHGQEIMGIIGLLQAPLAGALGSTASPMALLSATAKMNALAFFSGVSQGISAFTGNAALAPPPLPSVPVVPQAAPPPAPAPAPTPQ